MKKLIVCVLALVLLAGCAVKAETSLNECPNQQCIVQKNQSCDNECDGTQKRNCTNDYQCYNNVDCTNNGDCLQYRYGKDDKHHSNGHHGNH